MKKYISIFLLLFVISLSGCNAKGEPLELSVEEILPVMLEENLLIDDGLLFDDLIASEYYVGVYSNTVEKDERFKDYTDEDLFKKAEVAMKDVLTKSLLEQD